MERGSCRIELAEAAVGETRCVLFEVPLSGSLKLVIWIGLGMFEPLTFAEGKWETIPKQQTTNPDLKQHGFVFQQTPKTYCVVSSGKHQPRRVL